MLPTRSTERTWIVTDLGGLDPHRQEIRKPEHTAIVSDVLEEVQLRHPD
jgi:hypothetical protein